MKEEEKTLREGKLYHLEKVQQAVVSCSRVAGPR